MRRLFWTLFLAMLTAGCGPAETLLSPSAGVAPTLSAEAVRQKCTTVARREEPKLQTTPLETATTYPRVYQAFAQCARKYGYDAQCLRGGKWFCGLELLHATDR